MVLAVPLSCRSFTLLSLLFCFLCCWAILSSSQQQEDQSKNEDKSQKDQLCLRKRHSVLLFCYRVTQTDSLIAFNFVYVNDSLASARVLFYGRRGDPKYWLQILTNHIIESKCNALNMQDQRQRPHLTHTIRLITNTHKDQPDVVDVPVAYRTDSAPHRINYYPVDTYYRKQLYYPRKAIYPLDSVIRLLSNWVLDLPRLPRRLMSCHFLMTRPCHAGSMFQFYH